VLLGCVVDVQQLGIHLFSDPDRSTLRLGRLPLGAGSRSNVNFFTMRALALGLIPRDDLALAAENAWRIQKKSAA
jgi:hypothetical protein